MTRQKKIRPARRILNCVPSVGTENDWGIEDAVRSGSLACAWRGVRTEEPIPASVDLRDPKWDVGDQGSTGSCVGWAMADALGRYHMAHAGRIGLWDHLSVRFVWMAAKETDEFTSRPTTFIDQEGTSLKSALDIARKFGMVLDSDLPWGSAELYPGDARKFYATAAKLRINAYFNLKVDLDAWRSWLATQGPILTRLNVDTTWTEAASTKGNLDFYQAPGWGGHAVALVGYTPERFIVRNSWGRDWGDQGFAYASSEYAEKAFTEAYGVTVE